MILNLKGYFLYSSWKKGALKITLPQQNESFRLHGLVYRVETKSNCFCSNKIVLMFIIFSFLYAGTIPAQDKKNEVEKILVENGFENLLVNWSNNKVVVAYENRVFRFEADAIKKIFEILVPILNDEAELSLIPLNRKIPLALINLRISSYKNFFNREIAVEKFIDEIEISTEVDEQYKKLENESEKNSSNFRFDIVLKPAVTFQFGPYDKPVRGNFNFLPDIRAGFWKGMQIKYEEIFPLWNEFGTRDDSIHTGMVTLNQTFRMPNDFFLSTSFGVFTQERYGADFEFRKYFLNGDLSIGGNYGLTSYLSFSGWNRILYYDKFIWTGALNAEYRIQKYDLTLGLTVGKFLYNDNTIRFDVNREFGEIEIGFFALRSLEGVSNGGVTITVPLFPSKYWNPWIIRPRIAENYSFSYLVKSNGDDLIGLRYNTGNRLQSFLKKINPGFIKHSLLKIYQQNKSEVKDD
jgi:hypothetical protein